MQSCYLEMPIVMVLTTAQFHLIKPGLRFCIDSNLVCVVSEICNGENIWQWSLRLKPLPWINHFAKIKTKSRQKKLIIIIKPWLVQPLLFHQKRIFLVWYTLYKMTGKLFNANLISHFVLHSFFQDYDFIHAFAPKYHDSYNVQCSCLKFAIGTYININGDIVSTTSCYHSQLIKEILHGNETNEK